MENTGEKRTSRRGKRILILLLLLFVTGIMLTTSTYAWFLANRTVTVNPITVNVSAQNGIQVSVDGTTWKSVVQTSDITSASATYSAATNQLPAILEPVSTSGVVNSDGRLPIYYGTVLTSEFTGSCSVSPATNTTLTLCTAANGVWTPTTEGEYILTSLLQTDTYGVAGRYIMFDLFFKVDAITQIYLTDSSNVIASGTDAGIKNASRIAFINLGNAATGSALTTIQGLNAGAASPIILWEPNREAHESSGISNGYDYYGLSSAQITAYADNTATNYCVPYEGVTNVIATADNVLLKQANSTSFTEPGYCTVGGNINTTITTETACTNATGTWTAPTATNTNFFDPVTINYSTVSNYTGYYAFLNLPAGITKLRVYMWVEGQDIDCENTASTGGPITFNLQFSVNDHA